MSLSVVQQNLVDVGIVPAFGEDDVEVAVAVQITHADVGRRIRRGFELNRCGEAGKCQARFACSRRPAPRRGRRASRAVALEGYYSYDKRSRQLTKERLMTRRLAWTAIVVATFAANPVLAQPQAPGLRAADSEPFRADAAPDCGPGHVFPEDLVVRIARRRRTSIRGFRLMYSFAKYEAVRSFREAWKRDPDCAICYWGEAWAWGSNLNQVDDTSPTRRSRMRPLRRRSR